MTNTECRNLAKRSLTEIGIILMFLISVAIALTAQTFTTLADFDGSDGAGPDLLSLAQGIDGNFYGTTHLGGTYGDLGTVFQVTPAGTLTSIHSFDSTFDGNSYGGLILATDGNFYGMTANETGGTVYEITPSGTVTTIFYFCTPSYAGGTTCADGALPADTLALGSNGNFYGTSEHGGANDNNGTVFEVTREGVLTTLYSFCAQANCADGSYPIAGLVQGNDGNFYGSTYSGGANGNYGTIFKITPTGRLTTLHSFSGIDGSFPSGNLIQATDGNIYGMAYSGGAHGDGTIFKISAGYVFQTLYSFCAQANCNDGANPYGGLYQATDGNLYGTTSAGGASGNYGTVFQLTTDGALTTLHSFEKTDGSEPAGSLVQATNGILYGTTFQGGPECTGAPQGCGTVFSLSMGLGPFVKSVPAAGRLGAKVGILGNDLTGASQVTFNGIPTQFTVESATLIVTHVPAGATSGTIQVMLPGGMLSSNVPFYVLK
jgi:uncharacterized repeat protein (TIGR03803 family)